MKEDDQKTNQASNGQYLHNEPDEHLSAPNSEAIVTETGLNGSLDGHQASPVAGPDVQPNTDALAALPAAEANPPSMESGVLEKIAEQLLAHVDATESFSGHSIVKVVNTAVGKLYDVRECLIFLTPQLKNLIESKKQSLTADVESELDAVKDDVDMSHKLVLVVNNIKYIRRLAENNYTEVLRASFFVNIFSIYDVFSGDLIKALFSKKPELFSALNPVIEFKDILKDNDIEKIKEKVVDDFIDEFRRGSYVEQFEKLQTMFDIKLTGFDQWPAFVEAAQRRNLMTHCGGVVSDQYLECCKRAGVQLPPDLARGDVLKLSSKYVEGVLDIVLSVCIMLGQTLWRKILPVKDELSIAARHLVSMLYRALDDERWDVVCSLGEFSMSPPNRKQTDDTFNRLLAINWAIALKALNKELEMKAVLDKFDWTASMYDFKLAEAVLNDKFEDAGQIMRKIGRESEFVKRISYGTWPLFRDFRQSKDFLAAYEEIYQIPFKTAVFDDALTDVEAK